MIVREIQPVIQLSQPKAPRSEGVHASAVIRCIATEAGILKPEWAEDLSLTDMREVVGDAHILRISIGLAWEQYYIPTVLEPQGVVDHPGEMYLDGIYMTHDGESIDYVKSVIITSAPKSLKTIVHECKATYKSTRTVGDLSTQWMWLAQLKAYCQGLSTRFAKLHVLFLCGDYSYPIQPVLKVWEVEFTDQEIQDNWSLLREYRDHKLGAV